MKVWTIKESVTRLVSGFWNPVKVIFIRLVELDTNCFEKALVIRITREEES